MALLQATPCFKEVVCLFGKFLPTKISNWRFGLLEERRIGTIAPPLIRPLLGVAKLNACHERARDFARTLSSSGPKSANALTVNDKPRAQSAGHQESRWGNGMGLSASVTNFNSLRIPRLEGLANKFGFHRGPDRLHGTHPVPRPAWGT